MGKWLVAYDTPDDTRRYRLAHILDDYGDRVQYSVFEIVLSQAQLERLLARVRAVVDQRQDSLRMYPACESCAGKVLRLGIQEPEPWWEPDVCIV